MKNRSRPFHCVIAGKSVGIALRHGGGLQEPANVYVRCDERDCQYVDLNVPPCPLRIDMFTDGSDRRTGEYLLLHRGRRVCYACLTEELGITHDQVRRASWRLKEEPGFSIRPARCAVCHRRRVTIALEGTELSAKLSHPLMPVLAPADTSLAATLARYLRDRPAFGFCTHCLARELGVPPAELRDVMVSLEGEPVFQVATAECVSCLLTKRVILYEERTAAQAPRRVIDFLVQMAGAPFCASCVAFSTDLPLADTRRILQNLAGVAEFRRAEAICDACGRWQMTVSFPAETVADTERMDEIGSVLTGHVRYRGLRIDLLSFRVPEGWRPFAVVKTAAGALAPDVPAIVLEVVATRAEADELAFAQAREWIDKRVP
jgi:hypothetical protein